MILGTGIDIVELARIEQVLKKHGERFLERVYTPVERENCVREGQVLLERLAGKFAAKEALLKALGTGLSSGVSWHDVEIVSDTAGAPQAKFYGSAAGLADKLGVRVAHVSVSHSRTCAVALAVIED